MSGRRRPLQESSLTHLRAADATSHLFFAYLRSLTPDSLKGVSGISTLPRSLQQLVHDTEYPPVGPTLIHSATAKVVMIVDSVSPTPFSLLRRANHFQYRDDDRALQEFADYEDPVKALTEECRRVLKSISSANQSQVSHSKESTVHRDPSWSRFEDIGFSGSFDDVDEDDDDGKFIKSRKPQGLRTTPHSRTMGGGRPTTPSWADFLSSGFVDEQKNGPAPLLLPPDKILPPINTSRGQSSQSHRPRMDSDRTLEPGELASITRFELDDAFWWVWISSLAGEEPSERKAAFGRCALIETIISSGRWLVMEEMVKGAAPEPEAGAYIAEKKSRFGWTKRSKGIKRSKSTGKNSLDIASPVRPAFTTSHTAPGMSKASIGPDQHARIQAAAAQLQQRQRQQELEEQKREQGPAATRRGRGDADAVSNKTSSVFTLQPVIMSEASPAMKWANKYDKDAIRDAYLANNATGRGLGASPYARNGNGPDAPEPSIYGAETPRERALPAVPTPGAQSPPPPIQQESKSMIPSTSAAQPPAPLPPTPAADLEDDDRLQLSEKAAEVALPSEIHPIERKPVPQSPPPQPQVLVYPRPLSVRAGPPVIPQTAPLSPTSQAKQNKLKKAGGGGFKKMFGRNKNRQSKLPEGKPPAMMSLSEVNLNPEDNTKLGRFASFRKKSSPAVTPAPSATESANLPAELDNDDHALKSPQTDARDMSYDPSLRESISRVDTNDEHEAHQAFSSFDQGPLEDQPAFVPEDYEGSSGGSADGESPPSVPRDELPQTPDTGEDMPRESEVSPVQDRWAQIRKNAAARTAMQQRQSEEQSRGGYSVKTDGEDGETSGEESK